MVALRKLKRERDKLQKERDKLKEVHLTKMERRSLKREIGDLKNPNVAAAKKTFKKGFKKVGREAYGASKYLAKKGTRALLGKTSVRKSSKRRTKIILVKRKSSKRRYKLVAVKRKPKNKLTTPRTPQNLNQAVYGGY